LTKVLVTGAAGFIGFHLCERLLARGDSVVGYDNLSDYYSVSLKEARLARLIDQRGFCFVRGDLEDSAHLNTLFEEAQPQIVINLAAQAGVRHSVTHPQSFVKSNLIGFANVLEACRRHPVRHLVFASSSSVYGMNTRMPFSPHDGVDHPISLYAASKKANELMAHAYSHCFGLPTTGLRFFTVYGPWGRPDMALFLFTRAILEGRPIDVFNHGKMRRNFTYVDDAVEGIVRVMDRPPAPNPSWVPGDAPDPATSSAPYRLYNVGSNEPTELMEFIALIEKELGKTAEKRMLPLHPGDVPATFADIRDLMEDTGYQPQTPIAAGVARFVAWYRAFYGV
jgi:UDP-glucuronate 4-epimerase